MTEYIIVGSYDLKKLAEEVNKKIADDYAPIGGVVALANSFCIQSMVTTYKKEKFIRNIDKISKSLGTIVNNSREEVVGVCD